MGKGVRWSEEQLKGFLKKGQAAVAAADAAVNKFFAQKITIDGIEFDSKHEAERYNLLRLQEKEGSIRELKVHVPIQVEINRQHVFTYECDFVYLRPGVFRGRAIGTAEVWNKAYEDAKGYRKGAAYSLFRLKKVVIKAALGIDIEEV